MHMLHTTDAVLGTHLIHESALAPVVHLVLHGLHLICVIACTDGHHIYCYKSINTCCVEM